MTTPIAIFSQEDAAAHGMGDWRSVVSIGSPGSEQPFMMCQNVLRLEFDDVSYNTLTTRRAGYQPPTIGDMRALVTFLATAEAPIMFHCAAGISRSPAAAIIYLRMRGMSVHMAHSMVGQIRPEARPNTLVLELAEGLIG